MRADRLISLMLLLHARGRMTAQKLAEQLEVTFESPGDARMRILGLGTGAEVLAPDELRDAVFETARSVIAVYE
jgi:predicted DNA-binding transcriptional regulator YafY